MQIEFTGEAAGVLSALDSVTCAVNPISPRWWGLFLAQDCIDSISARREVKYMTFLEEAQTEHEKLVMLDARIRELHVRSRTFLMALKRCPKWRRFRQRSLCRSFDETTAEHNYVQRLFNLTYCKAKRYVKKHEELYEGGDTHGAQT